jgi:hypothetical protein
MRPTDFCHPNELRVPAPRAFPIRSRGFHRALSPRTLRLRAAQSRDRTFSRRPRPLRRIVIGHEPRTLTPLGLKLRTRAFSSRGDDAIEPLTPLSRSLVHPRASLAFASAASWPSVLLLEGFERVGGCRRPPRPPLTPSRERRRLVMIRDAFHRQVPFVGSGGPYSPGPTTSTPLLATRKPLDDDLSPPWVLRRFTTVMSGRARLANRRFARRACRRCHPPTLAPR